MFGFFKTNTDENNGTSFKKRDIYIRQEESLKIRKKYPDKIPVIIEMDKSFYSRFNIKKYKFLIPDDLIYLQFIHYLKNYTNIDKNEALFLFLSNGILPPSSLILRDIYNRYKNEDGFLYMTITLENTFGINIDL